jgi:hypothetical protein
MKTLRLLSIVGAFLAIFFVSCDRREVTALRAIGGISSLPLSPTAETARNVLLHYNEWDRADYVLGSESYPSMPFRATVRVLKRQPDVAYIELADGSRGWVPDDWLANCKWPPARRENPVSQSKRRETDSFFGLTRTQVEARLGPAKEVRHDRDDVGGAFDWLIFDETRDSETFFLIWVKDGGVFNGNYKGTRLSAREQ